MKTFANVAWTPEDIETLREDWTLDECEAFLSRNEKHIRDRLIELGWNVIETLIEMEDQE